MEILRRSVKEARRTAVFPGAFNPPTIAHVGVARAALGWADEVLWVVPRAFPHKKFEGPDLGERCAMLCAIADRNAGFSVGIAEGGLYAEIAAEAELALGGAEIGLVCGRDAADRIASWDYGAMGVFEEMMARYRLLVAGRGGEYEPHERHRERVISLDAGGAFDDVSSSEVRLRMREGLAWEDLVPEEIREMVARFY